MMGLSRSAKLRAASLVLAAFSLVAPAVAQEAAPSVVPEPAAPATLPSSGQRGAGQPLSFGREGAGAGVLRVLNQDRLLRESRRGQEILAGIRAAEQELERENQMVSDQLAVEERDLTAERGNMTPDAFRQATLAFDRRVEAIRSERARLSRALNQRYEQEAQSFFQHALPILLEMMQEEGIAGLVRPDAFVLAADWLDVTAEAIRRVDAATAD